MTAAAEDGDADAIEIGLVDREWLESPQERPFRAAPPVEMLKRAIEKLVERRPSMLSSLAQLSAPNEMRGRVMGALAVSFGLMPVGALFIGALAQMW